MEREQEIFDEYLDKDKWDSLYNISKNAIRGPMYGRRGEDNPLYGRERPPEVKRKITESKLRNPHPLRGKTLHEDHPLTFRGHTHPDEWRKDMSERFSGEGNPMYGRTGEDAPMYGVTGEDHPRYGVSFTPEQKKKRSELFSGEGNSFYGKSHSEETKAILRSKTGERIALELV